MIRYACLAPFVLMLAACGQKGPLYIPDTTQGEVVTRPGQTSRSDGTTTSPSNSPSTPDSPDRGAPPAPEVTAPAGTPVEPNEKDKKQPPK
jgi:predicted small lipoprotein YifL